ncbi:protein-tyrosine phosphatase-like protein, partial [Morchella snyderi]
LDEIYPNLWLGSLQAAESAEILQTCGITDVISITSHRPRIPPNLGITKTHFRLRDNTEADLLSILPDCIRKIEEVMSTPPLAPGAPERKVLVHCRMGISRSGGMVVAYAMKHANIPARLALEFVRSRRPIVNPNKAFMAQLTVWGECGYDTALL